MAAMASTVSVERCPKIAVCMGTDTDHSSWLSMTGVSTFTKSRSKALSPFKKFSENRHSFLSNFTRYTTTMASSTTRAISVPIAAPRIPISGKPKRPKISV